MGTELPFYSTVEANPYTRVTALLDGQLRAPRCKATEVSHGFRAELQSVLRGRRSAGAAETFTLVRLSD